MVMVMVMVMTASIAGVSEVLESSEEQRLLRGPREATIESLPCEKSFNGSLYLWDKVSKISWNIMQDLLPLSPFVSVSHLFYTLFLSTSPTTFQPHPTGPFP